jgi:tRNA (guanine37-N1)-methyltransferase
VTSAIPPRHGGPLRIDILTIFPEIVESYCGISVIGRAQREHVLAIRVLDLRDGATDDRRSVDDSPYGGGAGMVIAPGPVFAVVERAEVARPLFLLSPSGRRFDERAAIELASIDGGFSLLCGRYEGIDDRVASHLVDDAWSIGDYVLAGGELAALVIVEAVGRLVPGVVGNEASVTDESFTDGLLEYPHFTRPAKFREWDVPEVLLSGDHQAIERWRRAASLARTLERRPDLVEARGGLTDDEARLLVEHGYRIPAEAGQGEANLPPG